MNQKSLGFNLIDAPGHPDFFDEVCVSLRLADSAVLLVDVIEGVTLFTEKLIKVLIQTDKKFVLVINKIDRLILEARMPPEDAYLKIKRTLDEVNIAI